jgi:hypothetical protein
MQPRGHFIGALTLAFISIACASVNAKSTDGAADEHAYHHAPFRQAPGAQWVRLEGFATADQLVSEPSSLSQLHTARMMNMTHTRLHAFLMEDPT